MTRRTAPHPLIILSVMFMSAFLLRFIGLADRIQWLGDTARDYLVGSLLNTYGTTLQVGPFASGFYQPFYYPPLYYYLIAAILRVDGSIVGMVAIVAALQCLGIMAAYSIGNAAGGRISGYLSALFVTVSLSSVKLSSTVHGAVVALPFFLGSLALYGEAERSRRLFLTWAAFLLMQVASVISYLLLIPFAVMYIYWVCTTTHTLRTRLFLSAVCLGQYILLTFSLLQYFGWQQVVSVMNPLQTLGGSHAWSAAVRSVVSQYLLVLFNFDPQTIAKGGVLLLVMFTLLAGTRPRTLLIRLSLPLLIIAVLLLAGMLKTGEFLLHWTFAPFLLTLILCGTAAGYLVTRTRGYIRLVAWALTFLLLLVFSQPSEYRYIRDTSLQTSRELFSYITSTYGHNDSYYVYVLDEHNTEWESMKLWVFYEQQIGNVFYPANLGTNLQYRNTQPEYYIVLCTPLLSRLGGCREKAQQWYSHLRIVSETAYLGYTLFRMVPADSSSPAAFD